MIKYLTLFCLFLTIACSKVETGLNFAPRIATSKIDEAFDFDSEKLTQLRKQIDLDIQNSKQNLATKLIFHLDVLQTYSKDSDLKIEQIISFYDEAVETQNIFLKNFKNTAELVFKNLSDYEIKKYKEFSDKKYKEELELAKDRSAFLKKKKKIFIKNYKVFLDGLSEEQEKILTDFIESHFEYFVGRIKERQKFSEEFYLKIRSKDPILDFFFGQYQGKKWSEITDAAMKNYLNQFFLIQISIWKNADAKQKEYLKKTLSGYKDQLQKIASP